MARTDNVDEMNRLNKSDLIDIILQGVTSDVKISDNLKN